MNFNGISITHQQKKHIFCKYMGQDSCGVHCPASKMSSLAEKLGGYILGRIRKIVGLKRIDG
jgi:outer membrane protein